MNKLIYKILIIALAVFASYMICVGSNGSSVSRYEDNEFFLSELTPLSIEEIESKNIWDLGGCSVVNDNANAFIRKIGDIIYDNDEIETRVYVIKGDTIIYRGSNIGRYEMSLQSAKVDYALTSSQNGFSFENEIDGRGFIMDVPTSEKGAHHSALLNKGTLIIGLDTLKNISLIQEIFQTTKYAGLDSIGEINQSIIYRWYGSNKYIPIAEQVVSLTPDSTSRLFVKDISEEIPMNLQGDRDLDLLQYIQAVNVIIGIDNIELIFPDSDSNIDIGLFLMDTSGNIYSSRNVRTGGDCGTKTYMSCAGIPRGNYILSIVIPSDKSLSHKIFIDL